MDEKETLNLGISAATAMLGVVLALLAILPIVFELVSARIKAYFQAGGVRSQVNFIFLLLIGIAILLTLSLLFSFIAVLCSSLMPTAATAGVIVLIISMIGFGFVIGLGTLILHKLNQSGSPGR